MQMINNEGYLDHILKLLRENHVPELPDEYTENPLIVQIHEEIKAIRLILRAFSSGDFSPDITVRGIIPGCLKTLQANLRHLIWQVQMVEKGDFTQEVYFMGEFSNAFNSMVRIFSLSLSKLQEKGETLAAINDKLRKEAEDVEILKKSESHFKFLASHDPLTGVLNRRAFIETAEVEIVNAVYLNVPCCLAMMDLDHFKKFNDTYGHLAGDEVLRHTVNTIESKLRKNDFMGRYGGEEFVLFFYDTDEETGLRILERLRMCLSESPVFLLEGPVTITASFGFTAVDREKSTEELIHAADIALYAAKQSGRNKVVLFRPEMELCLDSIITREIHETAHNSRGLLDINSVMETITELISCRDKITGGHNTRTSKYLKILIDAMLADGLYRDQTAVWNIDQMILSATLHDIGKIAISDNILPESVLKFYVYNNLRNFTSAER